MASFETSSLPSTTQRRFCKDLIGIGSETTWKGFDGMASAETNDESLPNMWEECWTKQQLTQAPSAEITQKAVLWECRQRHDYGNPESFDSFED